MAEPLTFSRSLYTAEAVREAVAAYSELATFHVEEDTHEVRVHISEPDPEVEDLADHLANHILHLSVVSARRAAGTPAGALA